MKNLLFFSLLLIFSLNGLSQLSIKEIQGETADSPYNNQTVTTKGTVTGVYKDGYFIRENAEPWGGIYVYDPGRNPMPMRGDTILLTATVDEYYEWTELKNISSLEIVSTNNPEPEPRLITTDEIDESLESCFVRIEDLVCTNTDLGYGEWEVDDESAKLVINDMGVPYSPELDQKYIITGNISYSFGAFKLEPRNLDDIFVDAPVFFTRQPKAVSIQKNEITVYWETNSESSTEAIYGLTPALEMDHLSSDESGTTHNLTFKDLNPASLVYAKFFSVLDQDTAWSETRVFASESQSSGQINICFNQAGLINRYNDVPELYSSNLADTFIHYIRKAEQTLDLALYDFTDHSSMAVNYSSGIKEAIYQAVVDGIQVRLITDAAVAEAAPADQELTIPRLEVDHDGIMHHKFIIIDHGSVNNSWIITGSTNPNYNNLVLDFNNFIAIQDQSLAKAYLIEFEEIWGGNGPTPDLENSRSGSQKTDNSPHDFMIGGKHIELYFSPSDRTTSKIIEKIDSIENNVVFVMMAFTENSLGSALANAHNNNLEIYGIIDYTEFTGSEYEYLLENSRELKAFENPDGSEWPDGRTVHHKYAIIDAEIGQGHSQVITGSHNWTAAAESRNDENTLIIHDSLISAEFLEEYYRIGRWIGDPPVRPIAMDDHFGFAGESSVIFNIIENDVIKLNYGTFDFEIIEFPEKGSFETLDKYSIEYTPGTENIEIFDTMKYVLRLVDYPVFADTANIFIHRFATSVEDPGEKTVSLFPNPAGDELKIEFRNQIMDYHSLTIVNSTGRLMKFEKTETNESINIQVDKMKPGIYFIIIENDSGIIRKKFIRE